MIFKEDKTSIAIIALFASIKLILSLIADYHSGFDGDEVLYIDYGRHLAAGYMEAPPLIGLLAFLQNLFHSESVFINHIFVHIASSLIVFICGLIVVQLGGATVTLILAMIAIVFAPAFGITHNSFQPVIFDQLFWILSFYYLLCFTLKKDYKYLVYLSITLAFGFLAKYSILSLAAGLFISVVIFRRDLFRKRITWVSVVLFLLIISPNLYWQYSNDFPVLKHFKALYGLMENDTILSNIGQFLLVLNPVSAPVWFAGIFLIPFSKRFSHLRLITFTILLSLLIVVFAGGRFYYFLPVALAGFCTGAVYLERYLVSRQWIIYPYLILLSLTSVFLVPVSLPVTSLSSYVKLLGLKENDDGRIPLRFEARYTKDDWQCLLTEVEKTYTGLSPDEKNSCLILGSDYTQPAVINMYHESYNLPEAFSFHGSYYSWIPEFQKGITVIAVANTHKLDEFTRWIDIYSPLFEKVEAAAHLPWNYARDDRNACFHIYICRGIRVNSEEYKQMHKDRIFE